MRSNINGEDPMFKIVVIGRSGTGKTNISTRFTKNQFSEVTKMTAGVEFLHKTIKIHNQNIKVTLWDTGGQQKYKSLNKIYYKGASGVLIVYDITDPQSYLDVESWLRLVYDNINFNELVIMIVGNKIDIIEQRKITTERLINQYKNKFDVDCWEVSAKTGQHIQQLFNDLIEKIYKMHSQMKFSQQNENQTQQSPSSKMATQYYGIQKSTKLQQHNSKISKYIGDGIMDQQPTSIPSLSGSKVNSMQQKKSVKLSIVKNKQKQKCCS